MSGVKAPSETKWQLSEDWKMSDETYETIMDIIDVISEVGSAAAAVMLSEIPVVGPLLGWALGQIGGWFLKKIVGLIPRQGDNSATSFQKQQELYQAVLAEDKRQQQNLNKIKMNQKLIPNRADEIAPPKSVIAKDLSGVMQAPKLAVRNNRWKYNRPILPIMIYPKDEYERKQFGLWIANGLPIANPIGFIKSIDDLPEFDRGEPDLSYWNPIQSKSRWGMEKRVWGTNTEVEV